MPTFTEHAGALGDDVEDAESCHRAAGQLRNAKMIGVGADGCVAFLRVSAPRTTGTVRLARAAGIPVWLHTQP
jgi:hypothetical protein